MNGQDLRNSILQLAVQGKLVERREDEGTAKVLLKQIEAEKEQLIKEKKIRRQKALPKITEDEIPFEIPRNWEWVRLTDLTLYIKAGGDKPKDFVKEKTEIHKVPVIANGVLNDGVIGYTKEARIEESCITVSGRGTIGFSFIRTEPFTPVVRLIVLNMSKSIEQNYILYVLSILLEKGVGTSIKQLTVPMVKPKLIPLPPLKEQKRIVSKIEELMPFVEEYDKAFTGVTELNKKFPEDMQKSILQYAIQGKLVEQREEEGTAEVLHQQIQREKKRLIEEGEIKKTKAFPEITEEEIPFNIPEGWKWVRLGEVFQINPRNNVDDDTNVSFIPMALLEEGYQSEFIFDVRSWSDVKKGYTHFCNGDIVMAKITPCFQNLKSAVMINLENGFGAGTTEFHVFRAYHDISLEYFLWFIKSPVFVSTCVANMTGTAGQQRVGRQTIENYVVPLPPLKEQKRIVKKIEEMMTYAEQLIK
jgi:type I restriction enzyme S subunit